MENSTPVAAKENQLIISMVRHVILQSIMGITIEQLQR
jgi:hypothetical protein